ncbi:MAG TPA: cation diffusion facilitator family transporter [Candidatus Hydrogenedens sp.]|nr:cation diffusion facilitator family transporter [Candidatus Hydrogenedens sp.]
MPQTHYDKNYRKQLTQVTWLGFLINVILVALKVCIGYITRSQALIADGIHSLSDGITDLAVIFGEPFWTAPADVDHPHGHGRIEMLVTIFIGLLLGLVGILLGFQAIKSIIQFDKEKTIYSLPMTIVAFISVVSKEALYQYTVFVGRKIHSTAVIANAWHHRSDSLSSIPVVIAGIGIMINPAYSILDPIGALIVCVLIIYSAYRIILPMLKILVDSGISQEEMSRLKEIALSIKGVKSIHAIRSRHIGGGIAVDLHVLVDPQMSVSDGHIIAGKVKHALLEKGQDVVDVLIHIEPYEKKQT